MALVAQNNLKQTHNNIFGQIVIGPPGLKLSEYQFCLPNLSIYFNLNR
jgi:hypothetical protein